MIRLTNGRNCTMAYEEMALTLSVLHEREDTYRNHIKLICANVYGQFQMLRSDFEHGTINKGILIEFITPLKEFVLNLTEEANPALHRDEIVDFMNKENLIN